MSSVPFEIRAFTDAERPFCASNWLKSYERFHYTARARFDSSLGERCPKLCAQLKDSYYVAHGRVINELLSTSTTLLAHLAGEPDTLLGFAAGERHSTGVRVVHYVYVKNTFRGNHIARGLCDELLGLLGGDGEVVCSHTTDRVRPMLRRLRWPYVPYTAFVDREGRSAA